MTIVNCKQIVLSDIGSSSIKIYICLFCIPVGNLRYVLKSMLYPVHGLSYYLKIYVNNH